ncbi:MAG: zinc-ribbon domain-containing protein [Saprospiraceae bacterium]|nr:zinc-ribbon domain-containing protein [Candidatus Parvibacillus calidus]
MFCKSCGRQIDNDSTFCSFCGTKQSVNLRPQNQVGISQTLNTTQNVNNNEANFNKSPSLVSQQKYDPTYKKEDDAMAIGIIIWVIVLIFCHCGTFRISRQ